MKCIFQILKFIVLIFLFKVGISDDLMSQPRIYTFAVGVYYPVIHFDFYVMCENRKRFDISNQNFSVRENGISIDSIHVGCPDPYPHCCLSSALVFDRNPDMGVGNQSGMDNAKQLGIMFVDTLNDNCDEATIISIKKDFEVPIYMTTDQSLLKYAINELKADGEYRIWDAITGSINELMWTGSNECRAIIVFSNGIDRASSNTIVDVINAARTNKISIYTIGVGDSINASTLAQIANETNGLYYQNPSQAELYAMYKRMSYVVPEPAFCSLEYRTPLCADGTRPTIEITIKEIKDCSGSDTVTKSYKLPLDSANVYPIQIANKISDGTKDIVIPINIAKPFSRDFTPASFNILFDSTCIQFVGIENNGTLLNNIPVSWHRITYGISITTQQTKFIDSSGTLLKLIFRTNQPKVEKECTVSLSDWTFNPECFVVSLQSGKITIVKEVNVEDIKEAKSFVLSQNYPNPFSGLTIVDWSRRSAMAGFTIEQQERASFKVFDVFGREVLDLSNKIIDNSQLTIDHSQLASQGIYFYRLTVGNESQTRMMMLIK